MLPYCTTILANIKTDMGLCQKAMSGPVGTHQVYWPATQGKGGSLCRMR